MPKRHRVFVSYSHKDRRWLERLQVHLKELNRRQLIDLWDDTRIQAGDSWNDEIESAIDGAAAAILMISADFLASDYIVDKEVPPLLAAREEGALVIPVIVGPCRFTRHAELSRFQAINLPEQPLSGMSEHDAEAVLVRLANRVEDAVHQADSRADSGAQREPAPKPSTGLQPLSLEHAVAMLHVLQSAATPERAQGATVSDYHQDLAIGSRKLVVEAIDCLTAAGQVQRERRDGQTLWSITAQGRSELERLCGLAGPTLVLERSEDPPQS